MIDDPKQQERSPEEAWQSIRDWIKMFGEVMQKAEPMGVPDAIVESKLRDMLEAVEHDRRKRIEEAVK